MMALGALQLQPREKRVVIGGAILVAALLAYLLWPAGSDGSSVELVPADQRPAPVAASSQPVPVVQAPSPTAPVPTVSVGIAEGLVLHGVMAGGAVFGFPDGSQRYVRVGRDIMPGLRLEGVRLREAILATGSTNYRLGFGGTAVPLAPAPGVVAAAGIRPPTIAPNLDAAPAPAPPANAGRAELGRYLQALSPRQAGGQVSGYTLRPGVSVPGLEQAGLRPGDVILSVDGAPMTQDHVARLARLPAGQSLALEVERGGQRLRLGVQGR